MAEVVFRLPSKAVTYGYAEVKGTPEEFGLASLAEAEGLGMVYANYVHAFLTGEKEASRILSEGIAAELAESHAGPVKQDLGAPEINGLEEAAELIKNELGATEVEHQVGDTVTVAGLEFTKHSEVPWEGEVDAKPKPWETSTKPANAVANEDW